MRTHSVKVMALCLSLVATGLWWPASWGARADTMSSTNWQVLQDTISIGGNESSSTSYSAQDTLGEGLSGEALQSANYQACVGFQCYSDAPFLSFSVSTGTLAGSATLGGTVDLGLADTTGVRTSDGSTVNSVFISAENNATGGAVIYMSDANGGLASASTPADVILSQTATLAGGTAGYGICVFSTSQGAGSPTSLVKVSPYNGDCTKTTGHRVGALQETAQTLLTASGVLVGGEAELLVKASVSPTTPSHTDYGDTVTFTLSATY